MTTKVTIDPAGHEIEVKITEGVPDANVVTTELLKIGDAPRDFWIYGQRTIAIREKMDTAP